MKKETGAILLIGYGAPEKSEDIIPFLRNVAKGRQIPEERLKEVAHHYELIGGKSPLNELTHKQAEKLKKYLSDDGYDLPIFVGMRNWHPFFPDTIKQIAAHGVKKTVGAIMAIYQSDASWERYQRELAEVCNELDLDLEIEYTKVLFDHPLFIENCANNIKSCFNRIDNNEIDNTKLIFTAHSIPTPMAECSPYVKQFETSSQLVAEKLGHRNWMTAYQSRSGSPDNPWLEPDVCDVIEDLAKDGVKNIVVLAIGFICDHVEV
ncbi:MAG: ferrochelatase, partial [Thermodesulfobacteriota bacterium]